MPIALPADGPLNVKRTLGSLVPHPAAIGKIMGAKTGITAPRTHLAGGGIPNAENISQNMFQPINAQSVGIPDADVNFITSPNLAVGSGPPKGGAAQPQKQPNTMQDIAQAGGAANTLTGAYNGISGSGGGIMSSLNPETSNLPWQSTNTFAPGDSLESLMPNAASDAGTSAASSPGIMSSIGSWLSSFFTTAASSGGAVPGYESGGAIPHRPFGGAVLPDVISGVGDIIGAFFGDPGAGSQGTGLLSAIDGGKTEPGLQLEKGGVPHRDAGGQASDLSNTLLRREAGETYHPSGLLNSAGPGRTDTINTNVPTGAYVVPADVVSGIGEGNTLAGSAIIDRMFSTQPHGIQARPIKEGRGVKMPENSYPRPEAPPTGVQPGPTVNTAMINNAGAYAKGGSADDGKAPVVVAGGEHVISDKQIINKFGSLKRGHKILDHWVVAERQRIAKEMLKLPNPVGSKVGKK